MVRRPPRSKRTCPLLPYPTICRSRRTIDPQGHSLHNQVASCAAKVSADVEDLIPHLDLPEGIEDRDADVWEPLIAIADAAGGKWPEAARRSEEPTTELQ